MKSFLAILLVAILSYLAPSTAFTTTSVSEATTGSSRTSTSLSFGPFGGQPKDDGSPGDYLCKV